MRSVLAHTPSRLIRDALKDLRKIERSPLYQVDMNQWHTPNGACRVCLAGSVFVKTFGHTAITETVDAVNDMDVSPMDQRKLRALDGLRCGNPYKLLQAFGFPEEEVYRLQDVFFGLWECAYEEDSTGFYRGLRKFATALEKEGH